MTFYKRKPKLNYLIENYHVEQPVMIVCLFVFKTMDKLTNAMK